MPHGVKAAPSSGWKGQNQCVQGGGGPGCEPLSLSPRASQPVCGASLLSTPRVPHQEVLGCRCAVGVLGALSPNPCCPLWVAVTGTLEALGVPAWLRDPLRGELCRGNHWGPAHCSLNLCPRRPSRCRGCWAGLDRRPRWCPQSCGAALSLAQAQASNSRFPFSQNWMWPWAPAAGV